MSEYLGEKKFKMSFEKMIGLSHISFFGSTEEVKYIETVSPIRGVDCHVFDLVDIENTDLGVIRVFPGHWTPVQEVVEGISTIEGNVSGDGVLRIIRSDGVTEDRYYTNGGEERFEVDVQIGDKMQWFAPYSAKEPLIVYELCTPPWTEGRFVEEGEHEFII